MSPVLLAITLLISAPGGLFWTRTGAQQLLLEEYYRGSDSLGEQQQLQQLGVGGGGRRGQLLPGLIVPRPCQAETLYEQLNYICVRGRIRCLLGWKV